MFVNTDKCKARDATEANFIRDVTARVIELVAKHNLPINHIRFGRQVKSWGSTGVASFHVYHYSDPTKKEFWVNIHKLTLNEETTRWLEWSMIMGCFRFKPKSEQLAYFDDADITAYNLKNARALPINANNRRWMAARAYADSILGFDYKLVRGEE